MTPEELKEYAEFEHKLKTQYSSKDKSDFEKQWTALIGLINENINTDPEESIGIKIAEKVMNLINPLYGEQKSLRKSVWEKGFKGGHFDKDTGMTQGNCGLACMGAYYKIVCALFLQVLV
jgi:hypothetical protein